MQRHWQENDRQLSVGTSQHMREIRQWKVVLIAAAASVLAMVQPAMAQTQPPDVVEYYHADALGSVRAVTDASGAVVRTFDYRPFGEGENPAAGVASQRFTGKERDRESGLDYFGARYYANPTGRFTTVDPVIAWSAAARDPQLWNRYAYVRNNPLRYTDPDGRCIWDLCIGEVAAAAAVSEAAVAGAYALSAATVLIWHKRDAITHSVVEAATASGSALWNVVDSVKRASRVDPYDYPDNYPRIDRTGKAHTQDGVPLPDHVPETWSREMLEDAATTLRRSIRARNDEAQRLGEDPGHRTRINDEERLLRQIEKALEEFQ
jgi:RHS repeat-associated protein